MLQGLEARKRPGMSPPAAGGGMPPPQTPPTPNDPHTPEDKPGKVQEGILLSFSLLWKKPELLRDIYF